MLLTYGLIQAKLLLVIGGLLFLPVLPMVMAVSYGIACKQWRLAMQGAFAFVCSTAVLFVGGVVIAALSSPPMRSDESGMSLLVGVLISTAVGVAAAARLDRRRRPQGTDRPRRGVSDRGNTRLVWYYPHTRPAARVGHPRGIFAGHLVCGKSGGTDSSDNACPIGDRGHR